MISYVNSFRSIPSSLAIGSRLNQCAESGAYAASKMRRSSNGSTVPLSTVQLEAKAWLGTLSEEESDDFSENIWPTSALINSGYDPYGIPEDSCLVHEHRAGSCIIDEEQPVIVRPLDDRPGNESLARNLYWACCDGKFRNALREELVGRQGENLEKFERKADEQVDNETDWTVIERGFRREAEERKWSYSKALHLSDGHADWRQRSLQEPNFNCGQILFANPAR
ncbi:MAG: hypothetical protein Q9227_003531 [Pyrenula ochraceoflavens]